MPRTNKRARGDKPDYLNVNSNLDPDPDPDSDPEFVIFGPPLLSLFQPFNVISPFRAIFPFSQQFLSPSFSLSHFYPETQYEVTSPLISTNALFPIESQVLQRWPMSPNLPGEP